MAFWRSGESLESRLVALDREVAALRLPTTSPVAAPLNRWRADAAALQFHLRDAGKPPRVVVVLGGTGTGKSTLVNRLLHANLSAASFRRTYTAGPVAIAWNEKALPEDWLGIEHDVANPEQLPARGSADRVMVVPAEHELMKFVTLVDTPDLDGDQPVHHAQADRAFRWAQGLVFLVTPEKYQMTELLPYYRLARRYAIPALFVMNKAEESAVVDDYATRLRDHLGESSNGVTLPLFAVPRDDAAFEPDTERNLSALRASLVTLPSYSPPARAEGLAHRSADLLDRLQDQVVNPLREARAAVDRLTAALRAMERPPATVDVNPLTRQLQRRLQQRSILYLIGPGRMIDRVRQVPGLLARLPRTTWDLFAKGKVNADELEPPLPKDTGQVPDFRANLVDQFVLVQSRIEDVIRSDDTGQRWLDDAEADGWSTVKFDPNRAGAIADEELNELRAWLEQKWNATPRDTALLKKLLKVLPGAERLTKWSEAAPYLLTVVVASHHAMFGGVDLMILGGYSLATWLSERLSNEVASRTRLTNRRIGERFEQLAHEQIQRALTWLALRAPPGDALDRLQRLAEQMADTAPGVPRA